MTASSQITFQSLELLPEVLQAVEEAGYSHPTDIQIQSIPHLMMGKDIIGQAQTGTGKTAAFALPLLSIINPRQKFTQILILTPTRQ